ncbi:CYTH and CHAD domain-containing protein, partial [Streptomyces sp. NPDC005899]|uniref:CYTH and CHAD domain-containing protein n=1 Tax=Streptomyces sp. NPDC005899 TaxID=3155716 RepID=UPI0033F61E96
MADVKREIERKYEAATDTRLPDLRKVAGVSAVVHRGVSELDAVYYDTPDLRLAADSITLRRRSGGSDAGWHLKFPVAPGVRDEIQAPPADTLPDSLASLLRSRVRAVEPVPVVRLLTTRDVHHLLDAEDGLLAEVSVDEVCAERLPEHGGPTAAWTEIEVELADGGDPVLLDAVGKRLRKAGVRPATSTSKLARALAETAPATGAPVRTRQAAPGGREEAAPVTAGDHVLAYVRRQAEAIVTLDPAVRRGLPDSLHRMRVATRRLRSAFRTYRAVLDRAVTDPVGDELKWLATELGAGRDHEVLDARLRTRLGGVPRTLLLGPAEARLRLWSTAHGTASRERVLAALDSARYLALLDSLDAVLADPGLREAGVRGRGGVGPGGGGRGGRGR